MASDVTTTGGNGDGNGRGVGLRVQPRYPGTEARAGKFPGPSLIPALTAIQRRVGWLPREELVALSRDVRRPLYEIEGLISFYPHFRTSPPRAVQLAVCHDLTCWLHGSDDRIREAAANLLTIDEIDPTGKIPEFKFCAVRVERVGGAARHEPSTVREGA